MGDHEYYSSDSNFLSFDSNAGEAAVAASKFPLIRHVVARDKLRQELWAAVGIARALGRVLVLPRHRCFSDRYWYPILPQCRLPGASDFNSAQPCPLDQVIDVGALNQPGFSVETRVDGFLEHPRAAAFLASRRTITPGEGCLSEQQVRESLASSERILHLTRVQGVFCGFDSAKEAAALDHSIVSLFRGDWCCGENGSVPLTPPPGGQVMASPSGSLSAGPGPDVASISRAAEVWRLTDPASSKWQARLYGVRFPEGSAMASHNHYKCP